LPSGEKAGASFWPGELVNGTIRSGACAGSVTVRREYHKIPAAPSAIASIETATSHGQRRARGAGAGGCGAAAAAGVAAVAARPESISRCKRFKSARRSAAVW
jgi:hypothetical protein